jgi:hypothetical protein
MTGGARSASKARAGTLTTPSPDCPNSDNLSNAVKRLTAPGRGYRVLALVKARARDRGDGTESPARVRCLVRQPILRGVSTAPTRSRMTLIEISTSGQAPPSLTDCDSNAGNSPQPASRNPRAPAAGYRHALAPAEHHRARDAIAAPACPLH